MADKIVQLKDKDDNNIYPIASVPNGAKITMTNVDPGEGSPLVADNYIAVYGDDPWEFDYSLNEVNTGAKWIDGKAIYKKTFEIGSLPNNATARISHGITDFEYPVDMTMSWYDSTDNSMFTAPRIESGTVFITLSGVNSTQIAYKAMGENWNARTRECTITLYYTKRS